MIALDVGDRHVVCDNPITTIQIRDVISNNSITFKAETHEDNNKVYYILTTADVSQQRIEYTYHVSVFGKIDRKL